MDLIIGQGVTGLESGEEKSMELDSINDLATLDCLTRAADPISVQEVISGYGKETGGIDGYKKLIVWQAGLDLVAECYRLTHRFPASETYGLTQQLRRAAISVTLNIAEGWGRNSKLEFARFCDISRGSLHEVNAAIEIAIKLEYLTIEEALQADSLFRRIGTMLLNLAKSLRQSPSKH
ncbi:MAG: four helix bundle protein [Fimbriimonadaceae bacterium]|nr:four helix bundle protein [Fimbriimonadaceae bacterium]